MVVAPTSITFDEVFRARLRDLLVDSGAIRCRRAPWTVLSSWRVSHRRWA